MQPSIKVLMCVIASAMVVGRLRAAYDYPRHSVALEGTSHG